MDPGQIHADVAASGAKGYNSCDQWHRLDQQLALGDVLVAAALTDWDGATLRPCGRSTTCPDCGL